MIRLLLVDDQNLFREGLATLLSVHQDLQVVAEAVNGVEAVTKARQLKPDVILMDLRMPEMSGVAATREILSDEDPPSIIVLTTFDDDDDVFQALSAGAAGYLLKDAPSEQLVSAIRSVSRGEPFLHPSITAKLLARLQQGGVGSPPQTPKVEPPREPLSERELAILRLMAQGMANKVIAGRLHLADGTVKNYVTRILAKLDVEDRTQAALKARDLGWV